MKPFRLGRWGSAARPLGIGHHCCPLIMRVPVYSVQRHSSAQLKPTQDEEPVKRKRGRPPKVASQRLLASVGGAAAVAESPDPTPPAPPPPSPEPHTSSTQTSPSSINPTSTQPSSTRRKTLARLKEVPSPPITSSASSAKLSALHARLSLSSRIPVQTLARCLVDRTADPDFRFNNHNLSNLGNDLLGYWMGEHLICHYPRLPMAVLTAAIHAYVGTRALTLLCLDWGVEVAASPGGEVDPGLLQYRKKQLGSSVDKEIVAQMKENEEERTGLSDPPTTTFESASTNFVRALVASIYLHTGAVAAQDFFSAHILSRKLDISSMFTFTQPTRDLSRLCAREGFESPIARLISETGRLSRHPVFVVGVFSGRDKLGEDAGASLDEARFKAAAKALKGWYLYSPKAAGGEVMVPSMMEGDKGKDRTWRPAHIDDGEVIV